MRHFKLPLIVTGIVLFLALAVGIAGVTLIYRSKDSNSQKERRAQNLGIATGFGVLFIITPFWLIACGKVGKERRLAREQRNAAPPEA